MTKLQNIRFSHVHELEDHPKYSGFTVAYVREDKFIKYGYSFACKPDQFSKAEGRKFSTATLEREYENMVTIPANSHLNPFARAGFMCVEEIIDELELNSVLGDHVIEKMTTMDFKHAVISAFLDKHVMFHLENM
jgi:uncharacterized protein YwqG